MLSVKGAFFMADFTGTLTEQNIRAAFAAETRAWGKYEFYAQKAKDDGFEQIGNLFQKTADNEKEHAEIWFRLLSDGTVPDTLTNLNDAACEEHGEWADMYAQFAEQARADGLEDLARQFEAVGEIEQQHEARYRTLIANVENGLVFSRDGDAIWECGKCGHIVIGPTPPEVCPVCSHPKAYYALRAENY